MGSGEPSPQEGTGGHGWLGNGSTGRSRSLCQGTRQKWRGVRK